MVHCIVSATAGAAGAGAAPVGGPDLDAAAGAGTAAAGAAAGGEGWYEDRQGEGDLYSSAARGDRLSVHRPPGTLPTVAGSWALGKRQGAVQVAELQGRIAEAGGGRPRVADQVGDEADGCLRAVCV